jgi:hypothetical protein
MNRHWIGIGRYSDQDRYFGRFMFSKLGSYRTTGISLATGGDEDTAHNVVRVCAFGHALAVKLPEIIKPYRRWVDTSHWNTGSPYKGYWDQHRRDYGFSIFDGAVHFHYGEQTNEWPGSKSKVWFYPWREHNCIRHSLYDLEGDHFADLPEWGFRSKNGWTVKYAIQEACPVRRFAFDDFDGERIVATTRIEEREWKRGKGISRLLFIGRNRVERSLDLSFSSEVGKRKGSWKGGTVGHSITMFPGELHEAAFRRYCEQEKLTFVHAVAEPEPAASDQKQADVTSGGAA